MPQDVSGMGKAADTPEAELERLRSQQREMMNLLGTTKPERLLHDLRNLLQERIFLLAACESMDEPQK